MIEALAKIGEVAAKGMERLSEASVDIRDKVAIMDQPLNTDGFEDLENFKIQDSYAEYLDEIDKPLFDEGFQYDENGFGSLNEEEKQDLMANTSLSSKEEVIEECKKSDADDISEKNNNDGFETKEDDNFEKNIEEILDEYFTDLKEKSECPETLLEKTFDASDLKKRSPEENAVMREEFSEKKVLLKKAWEEVNGRPWPKYEQDVFSENGKLIRKAGSDYDAHHIQPLGMGGRNEANNITPLNAEVHYDKQGVHSPDSPYSKLNQMLGGME